MVMKLFNASVLKLAVLLGLRFSADLSRGFQTE